MKDNTLQKLIPVLLLSVSSLFFGGCTRQGLQDLPTEGTASITLDWGNLYSGDTTPTGVKCYFYGSKGTAFEKDSSSTGVTQALPADTYKVLIYNTGASNVTYSGLESYSGATVSASSPTKAAATLLQPSCVYSVGMENLVVSAGNTVSTSMKPLDLVKRADIKIALTGKTSTIGSCSCSLDGIVGNVNLATGTIQSTTGVIGSALTAATGSYESTLSFFGRASGAKNNLSVTVGFTGGGSRTTSVDISSELAKLGTTGAGVNIDLSIKVSDTEILVTGITVHDWDKVSGGSTNVN